MAKRNPTSDTPEARTTRHSARLSSQPLSSAPTTPQKRSEAGAKRAARSAKTASSESTRNLRRKGHGVKEELPLVEEGDEQEEEDEQAPIMQNASENDDQEFHDAPNEQAQNNSLSAHSNLSGATAVSISSPANEVESLRLNISGMLDTLSALNLDSFRILRQLVPETCTVENVSEIRKGLEAQTGSAYQKLKRSRAAFMDSFAAYTAVDNARWYILPELIVQAMVDRPANANDEMWRPDDIFYRANLAKAILVVMTEERESAHDFLRDLDTSFAQAFFSSIDTDLNSHGNSKLKDQTFEAALAVRTQLAISSSLQDEDFDSTAFRKIFLHPSELSSSNTDSLELKMRGWGIEAFDNKAGALRKSFRLKALQVYNDLYDHLSKGGPIDDVPSFSWLDFQFAMASWVDLRGRELNARIKSAMGAENIEEMLRQEIKSHGHKIQTQSTRDRNSGQRRSSIKKLGRSLGKRAKNLPGSVSTIVPAPIPIGGPASDPVISLRNGTVGNDNAAQEALRRGRSLIDHQPNAQRISFEDDQGEDPVRKETQHAELDVNVTQDQGFRSSSDKTGRLRKASHLKSTNPVRAATNASGKRNRADSSVTLARAKRVRVVPVQIDDQEEALDGDFNDRDFEPQAEDSDRENGHSGTNRRDPISSRPKQDHVPPSSNYHAINRVAKARTASWKEGPQQRTKWTIEETDALEDYIVTYGISWSNIKKMDNYDREDPEDGHGPDILRLRDQVALKDKARNMKMDYLKARQELPKNFNLIPLKKSDIERLRSMSIDAGG